MIFYAPDSISLGKGVSVGIGGGGGLIADDEYQGGQGMGETPADAGLVQEEEDTPENDSLQMYDAINNRLMGLLNGLHGNSEQRWSGQSADLSTMTGVRNAAANKQISGGDFFNLTGRIYAGGGGDIPQYDERGNVKGYKSAGSASNRMSDEEWRDFFGSSKSAEQPSVVLTRNPNILPDLPVSNFKTGQGKIIKGPYGTAYSTPASSSTPSTVPTSGAYAY